jgi:Na+-driven multidrug efflux pump
MLGLECASFEVTTAFAGYLGPAAVAAHAGVFSLTSLCCCRSNACNTTNSYM